MEPASMLLPKSARNKRERERREMMKIFSEITFVGRKAAAAAFSVNFLSTKQVADEGSEMRLTKIRSIVNF
jgi:hypothetical protein